MELSETVPSKDLTSIGKYFRDWKLQPSPTKTKFMCFHHLYKLLAAQDIFKDTILPQNKNSKYFGVKVDRIMVYKQDYLVTATKIRTTNNIVQKLFGVHSPCLVLLCIKACLAFGRTQLYSKLIRKLIMVPHHIMRIISRTTKSTPTHWLPTLSLYHVTTIIGDHSIVRVYQKVQKYPQLPINPPSYSVDRNRLWSRPPPPISTKELPEDTRSQWNSGKNESASLQDRSTAKRGLHSTGSGPAIVNVQTNIYYYYYV